MLQHFEQETELEEQRRKVDRPLREAPNARQDMDARIAAYRELGLSEQEAIADIKNMERQEAMVQQEMALQRQPVRLRANGLRAFAETSAAIGITSLLMRLAGGLVFTLARSEVGHLWPTALLLGAASCVGVGYAVESVVPRRANPAILTILALYLGAFGSEAAFDSNLNMAVLSTLFVYTIAGAGLSLAGARLRRRQHERRVRRHMLPV